MSKKKLLALPIDDLELSVRSQECLRKLGCKTIGDIVRHTESELFRMPNFGRKSLAELKEVLKQLDLYLDGELPLEGHKPYLFNLAKDERNMAIYQRHVNGELQKDLAREFGISQGRVSGLCIKYERRHHLFERKYAHIKNDDMTADNLARHHLAASRQS